MILGARIELRLFALVPKLNLGTSANERSERKARERPR
jgi:hypothetical protein